MDRDSDKQFHGDVENLDSPERGEYTLYLQIPAELFQKNPHLYTAILLAQHTPHVSVQKTSLAQDIMTSTQGRIIFDAIQQTGEFQALVYAFDGLPDESEEELVHSSIPSEEYDSILFWAYLNGRERIRAQLTSLPPSTQTIEGQIQLYESSQGDPAIIQHIQEMDAMRQSLQATLNEYEEEIGKFLQKNTDAITSTAIQNILHTIITRMLLR